METLRAEVIKSLEGGKITYNSTQKWIYMESFLRESARYNVSGLSKPSIIYPTITQ